jgi:hypothetical protein
MITIHFGKNPKKGGRPLKEKKLKQRINLGYILKLDINKLFKNFKFIEKKFLQIK